MIMMLLRDSDCYSIRNKEIRRELDIFCTNDKIADYKIKWSDHLTCREVSRIPRVACANEE